MNETDIGLKSLKQELVQLAFDIVCDYMTEEMNNFCFFIDRNFTYVPGEYDDRLTLHTIEGQLLVSTKEYPYVFEKVSKQSEERAEGKRENI